MATGNASTAVWKTLFRYLSSVVPKLSTAAFLAQLVATILDLAKSHQDGSVQIMQDFVRSKMVVHQPYEIWMQSPCIM